MAKEIPPQIDEFKFMFSKIAISMFDHPIMSTVQCSTLGSLPGTSQPTSPRHGESQDTSFQPSHDE